MDTRPTFEALVAEGLSVPVEGWDFSWFDGRATEERPAWGYARLVGQRMAAAAAALDLQTGGGEVLAGIPQPPPVLVATESWPPNLALARRHLAPLRAAVVQAADEADLPFRDGAFDLMVSRHPTVTAWPEIARVLRPGGTYLSQQIGAGTNRELFEYLMGPQEINKNYAQESAAEAADAGLVVVDLREQALRVTFDDIAAVIVFLRKVIWTVPDFTVARYRDRLARLHDQIEADGPFVAHAQRFLVEAHKPASPGTGAHG
jgi:SAM-dependent methyltransferase